MVKTSTVETFGYLQTHLTQMPGGKNRTPEKDSSMSS